MSNEEIVEGNKLIAEFMGVNFDKEDYAGDRSLGGNADAVRYHRDWGWLMLVVEKTSNYHYPDYWDNGKHEDAGEWDDCAWPRTFGMRDSEGNYMVRFNASTLFAAPTLIEAAWLAVVDFIKWHNDQFTNK